jgi:Glycosyl transferases group 1
MRIVFLGNFDFPFSTESHHAWTWEKLGHHVIRLQENRSTTDQVLAACNGAQIFQYTHTHGWGTPGTISLDDMLQKIHGMGVKSFSYHLDLYWGLNVLDRRESRIGQHPSWKVQYFFSTDGAHDAEYKSRGVNHFYLPPGVVEYGCHKGQFNPALASDIGFVGSVGYHPEYPFRTQMVEALQKMYGPQFRIYSGMREETLNNVYASCKIVVGDHCMAGMPRYWSDRLPETCGRGGFLIYPRTEGMTIPTATYEPQDLVSLFNQVAFYINNPQERERVRDAAFEHVKANDTYTHRLQTILQVMGF